MPAPGGKWDADQARRFFQAFQQHGTVFDKVSEALDGTATPEACEGLYGQHRAYLSLDPKFQSEVAFVAMVEDANKHHQVEAPAKSAGTGTTPANDGSEGPATGGPSGAVAAASSRQVKEEDEDEQDGAAGGGGTTSDGTRDGTTDAGPVDDELGHAGARLRRTPKRALGSPVGSKGAAGRTPMSTGKRQRAGARDEDIYEYYDEGEEMTASARKRRANKRLEFQPAVALPQPTRRKERADEAKGIDALLALAVAGAEGELGADEVVGVEDLEGELPLPPPPRRRTPHSTPAKGRSRPGSAHTTPGRGRRLVAASPLASPWGLGIGDGADLMGELPDFGYLTSPAFGLPAGYVPSPQNPMPRLRSRKQAPERSPTTLSPIKGLFGRRSSLSSAALLGIAPLAYSGAGSGAEDGATPALNPLEAQLRNCLTPSGRRWCRFEFFYSAIDRPFFMQTGMDDLLRHCGLAGVTALTRKEWGLLRAGLGRPRRLSAAFLREERCRLEAWRRRCRAYYGRGGAGAAALAGAEGEEAELPRAVSVGQRVTARHPITRQLHDGGVLTAAHDCYRVQFDRRELGVELVADVDVMPVDAGDCLPPAVLAAQPRLVVNGRLWVDGKQIQPALRPTVAPLLLASLPQPTVSGMLNALPAAALLKQEQVALPSLQQQQLAVNAKLASADPKALSELAVMLDKKEALLTQLRAMNDEAAAGVHMDVGSAGSGPFKGAYANVVLLLRDVNEEVQLKLLELEKEPGEGPADGRAAGAGGAGSSGLEAALSPTPLTADSLANMALGEAAGVMVACKQKLAEAAAEAEAASQQDRPSEAANGTGPAAAAGGAAEGADSGPSASGRATAPMDWSSAGAQPLASLIQGCVWSMVLLQRGSDRGVPLPLLASALDTSLAHARPLAAGNQALFEEVQEAMESLKMQLLAST